MLFSYYAKILYLHVITEKSILNEKNYTHYCTGIAQAVVSFFKLFVLKLCNKGGTKRTQTGPNIVKFLYIKEIIINNYLLII